MKTTKARKRKCAAAVACTDLLGLLNNTEPFCFLSARLSRLIRRVITYAFRVLREGLAQSPQSEEATRSCTISKHLNQISAVGVQIPAACPDFTKNQIHLHAAWVLQARLKLVE